MLLSGLWALLGATPGLAVLSQHLSHTYGCICHCAAQVTLVKRFHIQKHVWFLFYICSGFVFCSSCIFIHATSAATALRFLLTSFCHWQLWQLLCEHTPDGLTASCFLPTVVWGWRHGLCFNLYEFLLFCELCPTPTGEGTTCVGLKVGRVGLVLASPHWGWCGRSEFAVVQAAAVTLLSLDGILGIQTCVHRCGCCPVVCRDCSTRWSVTRQFGEEGQLCSVILPTLFQTLLLQRGSAELSV